MDEDKPLPTIFRIIFGVFLVGGLVVPSILSPVILFLGYNNPLTHIFQEHPRAILGIPWASGAGLVSVLLFRTVSSSMEFSALGLNFKGASGPVVLCILCFLAEVWGIHTLW
jgi:hypothetical protein